jgi:hypothetical protein
MTCSTLFQTQFLAATFLAVFLTVFLTDFLTVFFTLGADFLATFLATWTFLATIFPKVIGKSLEVGRWSFAADIPESGNHTHDIPSALASRVRDCYYYYPSSLKSSRVTCP